MTKEEATKLVENIVNNHIFMFKDCYDKERLINDTNSCVEYIEAETCENCVYIENDHCVNKYCPMYNNITTNTFGCNRFNRKG